jgi:hypothetical protein
MLRSSPPLAVAALLLVTGAGPVRAGKPAAHDPLTVAAAIDREIDAALTAARVPASPPADDAEFLRRVTLDLTGRIPTLERTIAFLDDKDPKKRSRLIDDLLASRDYGQHFGTVWRNRLAPPSPVNNKPQRDVFAPWLADQFNRDRGWHEIVTDLLTVEGDVAKHPQSAFLIANSEGFRPQPGLVAASSARMFLGVQLQCAECHDHPFAPWKQRDFWAVAAFFNRLGNGGKKGPPFFLTEEPAPGAGPAPAAITLPSGAGKAAGQVVKARFLGGDEPALRDSGPLRPAFASWLTAPENRFFAPALANRTWSQFFGRGLVNPADDFRDDNPPSHPELLRLLADECRASDFDLKHFARCVCNSKAYQRTSRPVTGNERDAQLYSHSAVRPLSPEAFYDSLTVLYAPHKSGKFAGGGQAPKLEPRDEFVRFFRAQGEAAAEGGLNPGIPQFLRRLNGETFNQGSPLTAYLVQRDVPRKEAIELLYLAALSRRPGADEVGLMTGYLDRRPGAAEGYAGVVWILLNTGEFVLNH